jgi:hypothetical protein
MNDFLRCEKCEAKVKPVDLIEFDLDPELFQYNFENFIRKSKEETYGGPLPKKTYHKVIKNIYFGSGGDRIGCYSQQHENICGPLRPWNEDDDYQEWIENGCVWK